MAIPTQMKKTAQATEPICRAVSLFSTDDPWPRDGSVLLITAAPQCSLYAIASLILDVDQFWPAGVSDGQGHDVDSIAPKVEGKFMSDFIRAVQPQSFD
jgi:hypothetical protein